MDNSSAVNILLSVADQGMVSAHHAEEQRATLTNFLVTISAALLAFVVQQDFAMTTLPISFLVIVLGIFGMLASVKFSQHYVKNYGFAKLAQKRLNELCPESNLEQLRETSRLKIKHEYPFVKKWIPIVYLWVAFHAVIGLTGLICIIVTFAK